ncbi:hypothetical protein ElyMa_001632800 [Elysia marginata]|uniref:Farnesoic acid O-methyl transferase domain-containing protein n=1 Tax=Elysia marginata TaxID=1093978 RepID=A0AAV4JMK0_9GAST|nr:hypothetical protein ElyMa_001632800 [Elysia marginata]
MELKSVNLCLCLLWILVKSNEAVYVEATELNLTYPVRPNLVFKSLPLLGVCAGKPGPGGYVRLEVKQYGATLGHYNYYVRNDSITVRKKMTKTHVKIVRVEKSTPFMSTYPNLTKLAFKICVSEEMFPASWIYCSSYNRYGFLNGESYQELNLMRYRPGKPAFKVYYHLHPNIIIEGEILTLACSAYVGTMGRLVFHIDGAKSYREQNWTIYWDETKPVRKSGHPGLLTFNRGKSL